MRMINELNKNPNNVFRLVRNMKIERTDIVGGRCMRGNGGTLYLSEKDRAKLWKAHMSKIMNEENERDQIADADTAHGPIESVEKRKWRRSNTRRLERLNGHLKFMQK